MSSSSFVFHIKKRAEVISLCKQEVTVLQMCITWDKTRPVSEAEVRRYFSAMMSGTVKNKEGMERGLFLFTVWFLAV